MKRKLDALYETAMMEFGRRFGERAGEIFESIVQSPGKFGSDERAFSFLKEFRKEKRIEANIATAENAYFCMNFSWAYESLQVVVGALEEGMRNFNR